jgi:hypothetical protein
MPITFYPYEEDLAVGTIKDKLEILLGAAERYKAAILDATLKTSEPMAPSNPKARIAPKEILHAFQWQEIALVLRQIRELPENNQPNRISKIEYLKKLAEVYEVLRAAKMPKLEAVRLALVNEVSHLSSTSAV